MNVRERREILVGEQLKTAAEWSLSKMGTAWLGRRALELHAFDRGGRIVDERLETDIAGIALENPVMVGAGWDKKGRAIAGLHALGFSAVEIGTVTLFPQPGNPRPRLWTIDKDHRVGFNRLGFNSDGAEAVAQMLSRHYPPPGSCKVGINIGLNKLMTQPEDAPWAHAAVVPQIIDYADYIALGISSPNTTQVRALQHKEALIELTAEVQKATGDRPLFYKIDGDRTEDELYDIVDVALSNEIDGIIAINTTADEEIKMKYGGRWVREKGGLSGADRKYRRKATETVRFIHREAGKQLAIVGVGGIDSASTALEKITAGASAVQVVTAIRPTWGRVAANIVKGLRDQIERDGARSIKEYIGLTAYEHELIGN